jgi:ubiquinone/menaquinone biosynthesis C-methylase UbiE
MLEELFNKYGCDKAVKHNYHEVYEAEFDTIRNEEINILEVGVFKGDSVRAWLEFFPNATIYGIDIFTRVKPEDIDVLQHERVKWLKSDSTNIAVRDQIKKAWPRIRFDIIIDDGLHTPAANAKTLHNLFPLMKKNGRFYVEDVWPLDIMTTAEMQHHWVRSHPDRYNILEMNKFTAEISNKSTQRFDLRKSTGQPDSYIIRVQ